MEIIIHGKPVSGCCKATTGLDSSLIEEIYRIFFQSERGGVPKRMALAVDTLYWKSKWHTIYSYTRYDLTDFSRDGEVGRRDSYFALSLVIPQNYLYLTSEVYKLLDNVFKNNIEGVYVSASGKYLVPDFTNVDAFNAIVNKINSGFANMQDLIDGSFKQNYSGQKIRYNLLDCDSKAFLQDLRQHGRIIVGEGNDFPAKISGSVLQEKDRKIVQLNASIADLNQQLQDAQNNASSNSKKGNDRISALEAEIRKLKAERDNLLQNAGSAEKNYRQLVAGLKALMPDADMEQRTVKKVELQDSPRKNALRYLPILNCVLLLFCILLLLLSGDGTGGKDEHYIREMSLLKTRIDSLRDVIVDKDAIVLKDGVEIKTLNDSIGRLNENLCSLNKNLDEMKKKVKAQDQTERKKPNTTPAKKDVDCYVTIVDSLGNSINSKDPISNGKKLTISWTPKDGYKWYASNLSKAVIDTLNDKTGEATIMVHFDDGKDVHICYRSDDLEKRNEKNYFILKLKRQ